MNLNNFEEFIDSVILKRGKDYYYDDHVEFKYKIEDEYFYNVVGTTIYETSIILTTNNETYTTCTCPYDFGPYCKHEVAVLFDLRENLEEYQKNDLKAIILRLTKEQLQEELIEHISGCSSLGNKVFAKYGDSKDDSILKVINSCFYGHYKVNVDGRFYLKPFVNELKIIIDSIIDEDDIGKTILNIQEIKHYLIELYNLISGDRSIFSVYLADISELYRYNLKKYSDKKEEQSIHEIVDIIIELFEQKVEYKDGFLPSDLLEQLLSLSYNEYSKIVLDELIETIKGSAFLFEYDEPYHEGLEEDNYFDEDYDKDYDNGNDILNQLNRFMYKYYLYFNNFQEAEKILNRHLSDYDFFEIKVNSLIDNKKYIEAKKLLEKPFKERWYDRQIAELKIKLYNQTKNTNLLKKIHKELFEKYHSLEYYKELKKLHNPEDLQEFFEEIRQNDYNKPHTSDDIIKILIYEERYNDTLFHLKKHFSLIPRVFNEIPQEYNDIKFEIYEDHIYNLAKDAYGRGAYKKVCYEISKLKRLSKMSVELIVSNLKTTYSNKPAFSDELCKIQ